MTLIFPTNIETCGHASSDLWHCKQCRWIWSWHHRCFHWSFLDLPFVMMFELTTESVTQESDAYRKLVSFGVVSAGRLVNNRALFSTNIFYFSLYGWWGQRQKNFNIVAFQPNRFLHVWNIFPFFFKRLKQESS